MATSTKTTAPKTADKPAVAPAPAAKPAAPSLDFGALTVADAKAPVRASAGRKATWQPHPVLIAAIEASWDSRKVLREYKDKETGRVTTTYVGSGKEFVVGDEGQAKTLLTAIRKVAAHLGKGIAAEIEQRGSQWAVRFAAKTPKAAKNTSK